MAAPNYFIRSRSLCDDDLMFRCRPHGTNSRALWSALDAAANPLASLGIAAGLLRALGPTEYGIIVVALAISGLSTAINPAIATTTTKFVAELVALGAGMKSVGRTIAASLSLVGFMDITILSGSLLFASPIVNAIFPREIVAERSDISSILLLAICSVCLQQIDAVFAATLKGLEHFKVQAIVESSNRATLVAATVLTGLYTKDARMALGAYCIVCTGAVIARALAVRRALPAAPLFARPNSDDFQHLFGFGRWMWINAIATIAFGTVDRILVGRVSGPAAAAQFSIYLQLTQLVHFVPASLFAFAFPAFSRLATDIGRNSTEIKRLYKRYTISAAVIGFLIALAIALLLHGALTIFHAKFLTHPHTLAFISLLFGFWILALNVVPYYLLLGLGRSRAVSLITSTSMALSIALTLSLTPPFGISGAALARLAYGIGTATLLILAHREVMRE